MGTSTSRTLRILVADDHEVVRHGVRTLLEGELGWEVCDEATTGREAVAKATRLVPDVVILDIAMPDLNGLDATRQIRKAVPSAEVLILTMHESEQTIREVLAAGARGYVLKSDAGQNLVAAVNALRQHKPFFTSSITGVVLDGYLKGATEPAAEQAHDTLTARERETLQLIAEGKTNKEVAVALGLSVKTVDTHRVNVMRKLGLHSVSELVRYAIRNKMIEP